VRHRIYLFADDGRFVSDLNTTSHTPDARKPKISAKRNTKKGTVYEDRESKQFAKVLTSSGVAVV
jgi:hypothetical protein